MEIDPYDCIEESAKLNKCQQAWSGIVRKARNGLTRDNYCGMNVSHNAPKPYVAELLQGTSSQVQACKTTQNRARTTIPNNAKAGYRAFIYHRTTTVPKRTDEFLVTSCKPTKARAKRLNSEREPHQLLTAVSSFHPPSCTKLLQKLSPGVFCPDGRLCGLCASLPGIDK